MLPANGSRSGAHDALLRHVDHDHLAGELAAREQHRALGGEVHVIDAAARDCERMRESHAVRGAEVEAGSSLRDHDREAPVRREVEVVRIGDGDRAALRRPVAGSIGVRLFERSLST